MSTTEENLKKWNEEREEFYRQPEVRDEILRHYFGDDYLKNWRLASDRVQ